MRGWISLYLLCFSLVATGQDSLETYISLHAKEINPFGTSYAGLNFLDSLLQNKRIVLLGESSHGTEEYSQIKSGIIQYLHEKLGFNVLLMESPMLPGTFINLAPDTIASQALLEHAVQPFWHTTTILQLFEYIRQKNICFKGFDPQFMPSPYSEKIISSAFENDPVIKTYWITLEKNLAELFNDPKQYILSKKRIASAYRTIWDSLQQRNNLLPLQKWLRQIVMSSKSYYQDINRGNQRDHRMAENIIWLADSLYPTEKIIVWAHNTHIDKAATTPKKAMGKIITDHFGARLFALGFYMINGQTALNNSETIRVKQPLKGSLEDLLSATGFRTTFIETSNPVFDKTILTWHWGKDRQPLNPLASYDAVILVNGVSPPKYTDK